MQHFVKTIFVVVLSQFALMTMVLLPAHGHEVRPGIVDFEVKNSGDVTATFKFDLKEAVDQFKNTDPEISDEDPSLAETAKTKQEYDAVIKQFEDVKKDFLKAIIVRVDGKPIKMGLVDLDIPKEVAEGSNRTARVVLKAKLPEGAKTLSWRASEEMGDVVVRLKGQDFNGKKAKMVFAGVVKAGEVSKPIPLKGLVSASRLSVFVQYVFVGFDHIIPKGLDHILFVVGLFLLSTRLSSLLWQISSFTIAHTITLGLAMAGIVSVPASIVEPLIAASIVYVAVENIFTSTLHRWRPVIVFGFGLLHGLGFASVLTEFGLTAGNFFAGLIGFNIGVEVGQLCVIAVCFLLVGFWFRNKSWYRSYITNPASMVIALIASYWFIERTFL